MDIFQFNKFTEFYDDEKIFFSKIDLIDSTIEQIKSKKNKCVLIVGNGDIPYTDEIDKKVPKNVKKIFAQNNVSTSKRVESIPLGVGNSQVCRKGGHDGHRDIHINDLNIFSSFNLLTETKFKIYCNFNDCTNPEHRLRVKNICQNKEYIDIENSNLSFVEYINKISQYPLNICPVGNGVDSYRIWETLYCGKIPITFRVNSTKSYAWNDDGYVGIYDNLYNKLPIIILDSEFDLENIDLINQKITECKIKWKNKKLMDFTFWKNKILKTIEKWK